MTEPVTLAITTAGPVAAALIGDGGEFARETSQQALDGALRCVKAVLGDARAEMRDVALIAVCRGPGSFTGLRIGVALANSIAQARHLPIIGVSSYDVAEDAWPEERYPRATLVPGKRDFFYVRVTDAIGDSARFSAGSREDIEAVVAGAHIASLAELSAAEQALRVARIAARLYAREGRPDRHSVAIDYGQRPNAVINWEARGGLGERGGAPSAANLDHR